MAATGEFAGGPDPSGVFPQGGRSAYAENSGPAAACAGSMAAACRPYGLNRHSSFAYTRRKITDR